jgi:ASC-1-like (ASCH) protein
MKIIDIDIQEPYFSLILNGKKTIEVRLNRDKFLDVEIGDVFNINYKIKFQVIDKKTYSSFKAVLLEEGVKNIIPDKETVEDALGVYNRFYSEDDERKYGIVGFKIRKYNEIEL